MPTISSFPTPQVGDVFGRWKVLSGPVHGNAPSKSNCLYYICRCACGTEKPVNKSQLVTGKTRSCGCLSRDNTRERLTSHGKTGTREYRAWNAMKNRCNNPSCEKYQYYGGKGIRVCDKWNGSFESFLEDMGDCPEGHTLDRIDANKDYTPDNCRWASWTTQSRNRSWNRLITLHGETRCVSEWSERVGIGANTLISRLNRGWSDEKTLTTPYMANQNGFRKT